MLAPWIWCPAVDPRHTQSSIEEALMRFAGIKTGAALALVGLYLVAALPEASAAPQPIQTPHGELEIVRGSASHEDSASVTFQFRGNCDLPAHVEIGSTID